MNKCQDELQRERDILLEVNNQLIAVQIDVPQCQSLYNSSIETLERLKKMLQDEIRDKESVVQNSNARLKAAVAFDADHTIRVRNEHKAIKQLKKNIASYTKYMQPRKIPVEGSTN